MIAPGSAASFDAFYRAERVRMFHYFRRRVGREAAPDLVQEVFARMLRGGAFDRAENRQAYLTRTARNLMIDRARSWHQKHCTLFSFDETRDTPILPDQDCGIEAAQLRRILLRALLAMPRRTRRIFLMHRLQRLTYAQIAAQVGISEKGVDYHMMQALTRLRAAIAIGHG